MQQMYLVEVFVDKVTVYPPPEDYRMKKKEEPTEEKKGTEGSKKPEEQSKTDNRPPEETNVICRVNFGEKNQFIIKRGQLAPTKTPVEVEKDEDGRTKITRTFRVGKSHLFPSYPDTMFKILSKYPLELELWTDVEDEDPELIGVGKMHWHTDFYVWLKDTGNICVPQKPLCIKSVVPLMHECCCVKAGEVSIIVRLSALGDQIITDFQQNLSNPSLFCFRTDKYPTLYECETIENDNPDYNTLLSLYQITIEDDPDILAEADVPIEVCTELQACRFGQSGLDEKCDEEPVKIKKRRVKEIRMGDIKGPCGNASCPLAHKVKTYVRNMGAYKQDTWGKPPIPKGGTRNICGKCDCKQDKYHREACNEEQLRAPIVSPICPKCGGMSQHNETCENKKMKFFGTGVTPLTSKTHITNYLISTTRIPDPLYNKNFIVNNFSTDYDYKKNYRSQGIKDPHNNECCCRDSIMSFPETDYYDSEVGARVPTTNYDSKPPTSLFGNNPMVYNVTEQKNNFCLDIPDENDCRCNPIIPAPACRTLDCECVVESIAKAARKKHRTYCPSYKHKPCCPVTMTKKNEDDENELEEDEVERLPYGLPPIALGPCPVLGRPCTVPDGFSRMYKNAALPILPPSYSEAGKVCCSKEFERIRKAIRDYLKNEKENDMRCVNKYNVDTERRCCDKEQMLMALMGKSCCGSHKMAIQEQFKK